MKKRVILVVTILVLAMIASSLLGACDSKDTAGTTSSDSQAGSDASDAGAQETGEPPASVNEPEPEDDEDIVVPADAPNPVVTITMENGNEIVLELYYDKAPNTVCNFIWLAQSGFYDGLIFHRVSEGFMIQGGCPEGTGFGNPGYAIKGEFSTNGYDDNDISHIPGVISMARSNDPDSAGSQFFICSGIATFLDGKYAAFGVTISGLQEVYEIAKLNSDDGPPSSPQIIKSVTVDTSGVRYPKPETLPRP